ncbi:MAG: hypothetical protein GWN87_23540 [Desulfuromonadales bacterium]|nr:hypothetical protein [Desulfuromonadales bacterium]NIS42830.1 hypothetical protein [Desulfuromonadales bacterium]
MEAHILRKCAQCQVMLGCYFPEKRNCHSCGSNSCPHTSLVTHSLCPDCFEEAAGQQNWNAFASKTGANPA